MPDLTKDSDAMLCVLYKTYLERRKDGTGKSTAKQFDNIDAMQSTLFSKWPLEDVYETCNELKRAGYVSFLNDITGNTFDFYISDKGIIYMENRFKDGLTSVLDYLVKIKSAIPFL